MTKLVIGKTFLKMGRTIQKIVAGRIYLFTAGGLKEAVGNFGVARAVAAIDAAGALTEVGEGEKKAKYRSIPEGGRKRLYHVDVEKLRAE